MDDVTQDRHAQKSKRRESRDAQSDLRTDEPREELHVPSVAPPGLRA